MALTVGIVTGFVSTALGFGNKATTELTTLAIILTSIAGISTANHLDTHELALIWAEVQGQMGNIRVATIDSGATSTAISSKRQSILTKITDDCPNQQIKIADDKYLEVVKIGEADFAVAGHPESAVSPEPAP